MSDLPIARLTPLASYPAGRQAAVSPPAPVKHPTVQSQLQPESLYRPGNAQKAINFYQRQDREGLKMDAVRFGIHGSPLARAENIEIKGVGSAGHGEITYQQQVTDRFLAELRKLAVTP